MTKETLEALAENYVAMWNEPDAAKRRELLEGVFAPDGTQTLQPPMEMKEIAARVGFDFPVLEVHGHDELEVRVARAYHEFIAPGEFVFRRRGRAERLHDTVKLDWDMVPVAGGDPAGGGTDFLMLGADGRVKKDFQFIDG